jgi:choline transporter-like protein 2/4/5
MKILAIVIFVIGGLYIILMLCCCNRIRLALSIVKAAAAFMRDTPRVFLLPIVFFFIILIFYLWWTITAIWLWSIGDIQKRTGMPIGEVQWETSTRNIIWFFLFGLLWMTAFIIGCAQFILAVGASTWYFSHSGDTGGKGELMTGARWVFRYHLGSIAFGALIIAIVQMIRIIFEYFRKKVLGNASTNPMVKCMIWCTRYCLDCLERCVKFITKNAYIQLALISKSFCYSAWRAFLIILQNAGRFSVTSTIGAIFNFLGKAIIVICSSLIGYSIIMYSSSFKDDLNSPIIPTIVSKFDLSKVLYHDFLYDCRSFHLYFLIRYGHNPTMLPHGRVNVRWKGRQQTTRVGRLH